MYRTKETNYSANVRLDLVLHDRCVALAEISRDWIVLRDATDFEPCRGEIVASVDGKERRWAVELTDGARSSSQKVVIRDTDDDRQTKTTTD